MSNQECSICLKIESKTTLLLILLALIVIVAMLITNCVVYANIRNKEGDQISQGWATFLTWVNGIFAAIGILIVFWIFFNLIR